MQKENNNYKLQRIEYEDEIDLIDLIKVLYKNKLMIILLTSISIIIGLFLAVNSPEEYEVRADITVVQLASDKFQSNINLYQNSKSFTEKLIKKYELEKLFVGNKQKPTYSDLKRILNAMISLSTNNEIAGYTVKTTGETAEDTYEYMSTYLLEIEKYIKNDILTKLEKEEEIYKKDNAETLEKLKKNIEKIKNNDDLSVQIGENTYSVEESELKVLSDAYEGVVRNYRNIISLRQNVENNNVINIIDIDDLPKYPVKPNKKLIVLISMVLGIFISVFAAFVKEFLKNINLKEFINEIESKN